MAARPPCAAVPPEFHDESLLVPKRVDSHPANPGIHLGKGEPARTTELEEPLLKDAQGLCELGNVGVEGCPEGARTTAAFAECGQKFHGIKESAVVRLGKRTAELARRDHRSEVDQGPRNRGHGQLATR